MGPRGYSAGRYFLGLGHHFVRFPATVKTIQFASTPDSDAGMLKSRTLDGLEVELEVSFQSRPALFPGEGKKCDALGTRVRMDGCLSDPQSRAKSVC